MTTQDNELLALAERCEKATGPDRELDLAIAEHFKHFFHYRGEAPRVVIACAAYTASLDAAMSLVPGLDWEWSLEWESGSLLYHPDIAQFARAKIGDPMLRMEAECATPALALCAAALRARATLNGGRDGE